MADQRKAKDSAGAVARLGALLAEGLLRRELLIGAVLLSTFTIVIGLTASNSACKIGYCVAGGIGIAAACVTMRKQWTLQWLGSLGICLVNIILLVAYGRLTGDV